MEELAFAAERPRGAQLRGAQRLRPPPSAPPGRCSTRKHTRPQDYAPAVIAQKLRRPAQGTVDFGGRELGRAGQLVQLVRRGVAEAHAVEVHRWPAAAAKTNDVAEGAVRGDVDARHHAE